MADGVISKWLKQVGDSVKRGDPLFEVESDKVTTEVEAPADGVLQAIRIGEGDKVDVGTVLAVIGAPGEAVPTANGGGTPGAAVSGTGSVAVAAPAPAATTEAPAEKLFVTPRARKVAEDMGIDLTRVKGTGPSGRILERDVLAAAPAAAPAGKPARAPAAPTPVASPAPAPVAAPAVAAPVGMGLTVPLAGMRKTIADRMHRSQQTVAEVTITEEADVGEVVKLRDQVSREWEKQHGFKVSYTEVIIKAVAKALKEHPYLNSSLADDGIRLHAEVNIGVGVALDEGLIVPVIRHADQKSLLDLATSVRDVSDRARKGQLSRDDVGGGTFTISNMGMLGVEAFTPIINWPECAILGVGRIAERAVVREGQIVVRPTMWLSLTFDHRIVDGAPAARFLSRVRQLLESPYLLFV